MGSDRGRICVHGGCRRAGERAVSFLFYRNSFVSSSVVCDGAYLPVTTEGKGGASMGASWSAERLGVYGRRQKLNSR